MKKLIQKYQVGGFVYDPEVSKKTGKYIFNKNGIRYDIWQASRELENSGLGLGYNDLYNSVPRQEYPNRFQPIIDFFKSLPEIKTVHSSAGFGMKNNPNDSNSKTKQSPSVNQVKKQNTKSSNRLGPNGGLSVKKQGGIIKAAAGWRVQNKQLQVQLSPGGSWYYVDLTSDKNGVLYYKVNGSRTWARVTTHDRGYWKTHPELMKITTGENQPTVYNQYFNNANLFTSPSHQNKSAALASSSTAGQQLDTINSIRNTNGATSTGESSTTGTGTSVEGTNETITGNTNTGGATTGSTAIGGTNTGGTAEVIDETTTKKDEKTPVNTYERLVAANTAAFNNGINSAYWRRQYRKNFNRAVANGNLYNKENNTGTYVFDINGMSAQNIIDNYWTPGKGLTRKQMRKLRKEYNKPSSDKLESGRQSFYGFNSNKQTV